MRRAAMAIVVLAAALTGSLATASPALATPPPQHVVTTDLAWFAENWALPDIDCGTFTIRETVIRGRQDMITYFNDAGDPVRVFEHTSFDGVLTNLSSGKSLRDHLSDNSVFPIVNGDFSIVIGACDVPGLDRAPRHSLRDPPSELQRLRSAAWRSSRSAE